ncbi:hypothetical protein ACQY0O_007496 [Thecaphora frezii]
MRLVRLLALPLVILTISTAAPLPIPHRTPPKPPHTPLQKRIYKAETWIDKPLNLLLVTGLGVATMFPVAISLQAFNKKKACDYVKKQQHHLQEMWDQRNPRGFVAVGTQMRPIEPKCQKELVDYRDHKGYQWY